MKKEIFFPLFIVALGVFTSNCARVAKVQVLEKSQVAGPYESLGTLEVSAKALVLKPSNIAWGALETVTLTAADTPSASDQYKATLNRKLINTARNTYGADALINVQYWPDPNTTKYYPDGVIKARAEMIRYKPFAEKPSTEILQK